MVTSTGKPIQHRDLILALLDSVQKPAQVAICKCAAHKKGTDPITQGNGLADKAAKEAAGGKQETHSYLAKPVEIQKTIDETWLTEMQRTATKMVIKRSDTARRKVSIQVLKANLSCLPPCLDMQLY